MGDTKCGWLALARFTLSSHLRTQPVLLGSVAALEWDEFCGGSPASAESNNCAPELLRHGASKFELWSTVWARAGTVKRSASTEPLEYFIGDEIFAPDGHPVVKDVITWRPVA
jgi:hypothetical protein